MERLKSNLHCTQCQSYFKLIFMDVSMPIMDGYEATKKIREIESKSGLHSYIVGLTAHCTEDFRIQGLKSGMNRLCKYSNDHNIKSYV